ncbi:MAG: phage holin family protein [Hydrogenophaga sp.]|uniref:phage holin family protein n=1 Tax=Hydrogenophaga sp. TaxID=1904254 RepID=UPI001D91DDC9|nr:phage holin family protein [Hydrogenophaga sp.]MBX3609291.1 phage holin family protein [Hydrogenophaga sp.]
MGPAGQRLSGSLRGLAGTLLELAQVRLELFSVEAQEEVLRVAGLVAYGAIALVCLALGLCFVAMLVTVALWDTHRLLALAVFAGVFLVAGLLAAWQARSRVLRGSRLFSASIDELRQDREALEP